MGMFSNYSLEEAREHFAKFLASEEFKQLSKEYFSSLMEEEPSIVKKKKLFVNFSRQMSELQVNSVMSSTKGKMKNILPNQISNFSQMFQAA